MNNTKLKALEDGLTGIAAKVLRTVPIQQAWTTVQILAEFKRHGGAPDAHTVGGCLTALVDQGLIKEGPRGTFQRVAPKPEPERQLAQAPASERAASAPAPRATTAFDRLGAAAAGIRQVARDLNAAANDIETAALDMEQRVSDAAAKSAKAQQIAQLLKGLED